MTGSIFRFASSLVLATSLCLPASAQEPAWPTKPVHLIVPGGTGGILDLRAHWLAEKIAPALGQPVIVEVRAGAGGNIGTEIVARSAPDGYTLLMVHLGTMAVNPHLYNRLGYDPLVDFAPITRTGVGPLVLAVYPGLQVNSVAELVQLAKAKPGLLSYGSNGIGTPPHLAAELFKQTAGISSTHVPYKGAGQSVADLIGGHISWTIDGSTVLLPQAAAGRVRALAVTSAQRLPTLPDIPTIAESGFPGYEFVAWVGLAAPASTPKPIIAKLYAVIAKALNSSEGRDFFASFGSEPGGEPPEAFAAIIRAEHAKWGKIVREAGIKLE